MSGDIFRTVARSAEAEIEEKRSVFITAVKRVATEEEAAAFVKERKKAHPDAAFAVHPESPAEVVALADMVGATSEIINYAKAQEGKVIIGTERGVVDYLAINEPNGERFIQLAPEKLCCEDMKKISLDDVYKSIIGEAGEKIELPEDLRKNALVSINRMLELG